MFIHFKVGSVGAANVVPVSVTLKGKAWVVESEWLQLGIYALSVN